MAETRLAAVLYLDIAGWSRSEDADWVFFAKEVLPPLLDVIEEDGKPRSCNTWGDGLLCIFDTAAGCAKTALRIRDFYVRGAFRARANSVLLPRIALNAGEVHCLFNPLLGKIDFFGEVIHRAARLEPIVEPGDIWCTSMFRSHCTAVPSQSPSFSNIGLRRLAKDYGDEQIFRVLWPGEIETCTNAEPATAATADANVAPRKHLVSRGRRCATNLKSVGLSLELAANTMSDAALRELGMVKSLGTGVLVDALPVSEKDYIEFCDHTKTRPPSYLSSRTARPDVPVVFLTAYEADRYASWLGKRLPSKAEWRDLAHLRSDGTYATFPWGEGPMMERCNCHESGNGTTTPFTDYPDGQSACGAFDVVGNTWSWLSESAGGDRWCAGGSFHDSWKYCRIDELITWNPSERTHDIGLRCVI